MLSEWRTWTCQGCGATGAEQVRGGPRKWCSEKCRKRQYDRACIDCGARTSGTDPGRHGGRCKPCGDAAIDYFARPGSVQARETRERIAAMWQDGQSMREICEALGYSKGHLGVAIWRMRQAGYDVPYRYARKQVAA